MTNLSNKIPHLCLYYTNWLLFISYIILEYAYIIWGNCTFGLSDWVEAIQRQAAKIIIGAIICTAQNVMYGELGLIALSSWQKHDIWSICN